MSHAACPHCRQWMPIYELAGHGPRCQGGERPSKAPKSSPTAHAVAPESSFIAQPPKSKSIAQNATLQSLLGLAAPHAVAASRTSAAASPAASQLVLVPPSEAAAGEPGPSPNLGTVATQDVDRHEPHRGGLFKCPRCLARVESAELSRHLRRCVREHRKAVAPDDDYYSDARSFAARDDAPAAVPSAQSDAAQPVVHDATAQRSMSATRPPAAAVTAPPGLRICPLCCRMCKAEALPRHLDECPENKASCPHCYDGVALRDMDAHVRGCPRHRQQCYICGTSVQFAELSGHMAGCAVGGRVMTMFHGTDTESARAILRSGFKPSERGLLGVGVYLSRDPAKAHSYGPVVLEARVDVGRVVVIDRPGHPQQRNWNAHGFDSAWIPPGNRVSKSKLEEHCVHDPRRIAVVGVKSEA